MWWRQLFDISLYFRLIQFWKMDLSWTIFSALWKRWLSSIFRTLRLKDTLKHSIMWKRPNRPSQRVLWGEVVTPSICYSRWTHLQVRGPSGKEAYHPRQHHSKSCRYKPLKIIVNVIEFYWPCHLTLICVFRRNGNSSDFIWESHGPT